MASQPSLRCVGVLGGMGPQATVHLMSRVMALTPAGDDADHIPLLVDNNTQVPSRIAALIDGTGANPAPVLAEMARRLEAAGAAALAMPCNTAHHYAPHIAAAVQVPFLNMVALSAERMVEAVPGRSRVGVLASPAVRITGIFDRALGRVGLEATHPGDPDRLLAAIRAVKAGADQRMAQVALDVAGRDLMRSGAGALLIACSELSVLTAGALPLGPSPVPVIDTIDVLADAMIRFSRTGNAAPGAVDTVCSLSA